MRYLSAESSASSLLNASAIIALVFSAYHVLSPMHISPAFLSSQSSQQQGTTSTHQRTQTQHSNASSSGSHSSLLQVISFLFKLSTQQDYLIDNYQP